MLGAFDNSSLPDHPPKPVYSWLGSGILLNFTGGSAQITWQNMLAKSLGRCIGINSHNWGILKKYLPKFAT
jgi:hypothetical protein